MPAIVCRSLLCVAAYSGAPNMRRHRLPECCVTFKVSGLVAIAHARLGEQMARTGGVVLERWQQLTAARTWRGSSVPLRNHAAMLVMALARMGLASWIVGGASQTFSSVA
jgi:hypothetical protein